MRLGQSEVIDQSINKMKTDGDCVARIFKWFIIIWLNVNNFINSSLTFVNIIIQVLLHLTKL